MLRVSLFFDGPVVVLIAQCYVFSITKYNNIISRLEYKPFFKWVFSVQVLSRL